MFVPHGRGLTLPALVLRVGAGPDGVAVTVAPELGQERAAFTERNSAAFVELCQTPVI